MKSAPNSIIAGSHLKKLAKHGSFYMIGNVLVAGGSALLLPIYTRELAPDQYAIFKNLISAGLVMAIFVSLHLDYAYARFFVDQDDRPERLRTLFSTILWFGAAWGAVMCIAAFFVLRRWVVESLQAQAWPHLAIACAIPYVATLNVLASAHFRSYHRSGIVTLSSAAGFFAGALLSIVLLLVFDLGASALLWGALASPCVSAAWCYTQLAREGLIGFCFSFAQLRETLAYSLGVVPMAGAAWLAGQADAIFVAELSTLTQSGIYSVAFDIGRFINLLVLSVFLAYTPMVYRMLKEGAPRSIVRIEQFQAFLIHFTVGTAFFLSAFAPELFTLLVQHGEYHAGISVVPVIAAAFVLSAVRKLHAVLLYYHKATLLLSIGGILQAAVSVGMNFLLIPRYGAVAAAWAKLIGFAVAGLYAWGLAQRFQPLRFDRAALGLTAMIVAFCFGVIALSQFVLHVPFWPLAGIKLGVMFIALWWTWRSRFGDQIRTVLVRPKPANPAEPPASPIA